MNPTIIKGFFLNKIMKPFENRLADWATVWLCFLWNLGITFHFIPRCDAVLHGIRSKHVNLVVKRDFCP